MPVRKILISQPKPANDSPYFEIAKKFNVEVDFREFFKISPVCASELRKIRLDLNNFNAVLFTSKIAVDHFFRVATEMRYTVPTSLKYFCINETISTYLSKYIVYRKRKIFPCDGDMDKFVDLVAQYPNENFLFPVADNHRNTLINKLKRKKLTVSPVVFYKIDYFNLSDVVLDNYDILVLFSPSGVRALQESFNDITDKKINIATFGIDTAREANKAKLKVKVKAPTNEFPSMAMALENYLKNGKSK